MSTLQSRLEAIQQEKSHSVRSFASLIGCKQVTIDQQIKGKRAVSVDTVIAVVSAFEDISPEWFLIGKGEMYKSSGATYNFTQNKVGNGSAIGIGNSVGISSSVDVSALMEENESLKKENKEIQDRCNKLMDKLLSL